MPEIEILVVNYSRISKFYHWNHNIRIFPLLLFVAKNRGLYESNSEIHNINTRFGSDLHTPTANLTTFQKGPFYFGIKLFNHLPTSIKNTSHGINQFRSVLKNFLPINSFY